MIVITGLFIQGPSREVKTQQLSAGLGLLAFNNYVKEQDIERNCSCQSFHWSARRSHEINSQSRNTYSYLILCLLLSVIKRLLILLQQDLWLNP